MLPGKLIGCDVDKIGIITGIDFRENDTGILPHIIRFPELVLFIILLLCNPPDAEPLLRADSRIVV